MERPRKLVLTDWTQANNALIRYFEGNKSKLAEHVKMSRTTVTNFFGEKPIRESEFRNLCLALRLNWEAVSSVHTIASPATSSQPDHTLIQQVREHCRQRILNQHSRMRLLSGEEIGVDQLYVDVWLLNRSPRTFQVSPNKLLETFDLRNDRLGLGDRIRRNPGFEVANANPKLVILGKPGSGKTTFLKHLAVDWCKGKFQANMIAVLIELRRIRDEQWNLIETIDQELGLENWQQFKALKEQIENFKQQQQENQVKNLQQQLENLPLQSALQHGRFLVLMDGLDEVPTGDLRQTVQFQLQQLAADYPYNRLILTCRTQIMESIPVGFTSVEVADFSEEQVQRFVQNWFAASEQSSVAIARQLEMFDYAINRNPALKELTMTPVLLSLICLVLQDSGEIPSQRDWLYQKGVKLMLSKWNDTKQIDKWEVGSETYRQLSIEQKEALLIEIAASKLENPENFVLYQQREIAAQITDFLQLAHFREGVAVLKSIEAQHGLLIERADELWSFSHLTFQEHFTFQWLTQLPSEQLATKIANQQWQEAVKQIVKSQQPADRLLRLIKQAIDQSITSEPTLQKMLLWLFQKPSSTETNCKLAAIRALNLDTVLVHNYALNRTVDYALDCVLDRALAFDRDRNSIYRGFELHRDLTYALTRALDYYRDLDYALDRTLFSILDDAPDHSLNYHPALVNQLKQLRYMLPTMNIMKNTDSFQQWWLIHGTQWIEQLQQVMIEHRNTSRDWQFTDAQKQKLQRYYDANKFLVGLMQIEGAVSDDVRAEIEDSLLLPWEELQRRQS